MKIDKKKEEHNDGHLLVGFCSFFLFCLPLDKVVRKEEGDCEVGEFRRFLTESWPSATVVETPVGSVSS